MLLSRFLRGLIALAAPIVPCLASARAEPALPDGGVDPSAVSATTLAPSDEAAEAQAGAEGEPADRLAPSPERTAERGPAGPPAASAAPGGQDGPAPAASPEEPHEVGSEHRSAAAPGRARPPRLKIHGVGFGYHAVLFRTQRGDGYAIHGPSLVYDYYVGRTFGFAIHAETFFPAYGRYTDRGDDPLAADFRGPLFGLYADRHSGFDTALMLAYRRELKRALTLFLSGGVHAQTFTLKGSEYRIVESISMGIAANARVEWSFRPALALHAELFVGADPMDMIDHENPAVITGPLACAFGVDARY